MKIKDINNGELLDDNEPIEEMEDKASVEDYIESLKSEIDTWKQKYTYTLADFENYKKRTDKMKSLLISNTVEETILSILPVLDDFERAFNHNELAEGGKLIYKKLVDTIGGLGVERIEINEDTNFNVDEHEAISMIGNNNKVVEEVLAGYKLNSKVIRYAKVVVG